MESLALLILILLMISLLSGPIGLILASNFASGFSRRYSALWIIRRSLIVILAFAGTSVSLMFIVNQIPITPKLLAATGLTLNVIAIKREFARNKPWRSFFRIGYNDPNGPAGQS